MTGAAPAAPCPDPVPGLAVAWAKNDPLEAYIDAADDGPRPTEDIVASYLAEHDPYPDGTPVWAIEHADDTTPGHERWVAGEVFGHPDDDEWSVFADDGTAADGRWIGYRDHTELRPRGAGLVTAPAADTYPGNRHQEASQ